MFVSVPTHQRVFANIFWFGGCSEAVIPEPRQMQAAISSRNNNFQVAETQRLSEIHGICFLDISNHTSRFQYYSIFAADFLSLIFYEAYRKVKGKYFSNSFKIFVMWWCLMSTMQHICKTQQGCLHYMLHHIKCFQNICHKAINIFIIFVTFVPLDGVLLSSRPALHLNERKYKLVYKYCGSPPSSTSVSWLQSEQCCQYFIM